MRIVMLGTGDFALPTFLHLVETGHRVAALITQPDRPQGRDQKVIASLIKRAAVERGVLVFQPEDVNAADALEVIRSLEPDLLVTAAYGQILSAELLGMTPMGGINLHGSVLPSYRGAAPVARAIQNGEIETGVTVIRMTPRIDAGGMMAVARTEIGLEETAGELEARLAVLGAPLVVQAIADLAARTERVIRQERGRVTRAPKLSKAESGIDWTKPAKAVHDHVRALQPWPMATTTWRSADPGRAPLRLIIHKTVLTEGDSHPGEVIEARGERLIVGTGSGAVGLRLVQVPGRKALAVGEFLRGYPVSPGDRMGD